MSTQIEDPSPLERYQLGWAWLAHRKRVWITIFLASFSVVPTSLGNWFQSRMGDIEKTPDTISNLVKNYKHLQEAWPLIKPFLGYMVLRGSEQYEALQIKNHLLWGVHVLIILVILYLSLQMIKLRPCRSSSEDIVSIASVAAKRFYWWWIAIIVSWLLLFGLKFLLDPGPGPGSGASVVTIHSWYDVLNNLEAVFFLGAYFEMTAITLDEKGRPYRKVQVLESLALFGIWLVLSVLGILCPGAWWHALSGLLVGVSMALLVSRFASVYIGTPLVFLIALFFYAVLQATYPESFDANSLFAKFLNLALSPLKIMMFLVVDWILCSGKLVFYMGRERRHLMRMEDEWVQYCESVDGKNEQALLKLY